MLLPLVLTLDAWVVGSLRPTGALALHGPTRTSVTLPASALQRFSVSFLWAEGGNFQHNPSSMALPLGKLDWSTPTTHPHLGSLNYPALPTLVTATEASVADRA